MSTHVQIESKNVNSCINRITKTTSTNKQTNKQTTELPKPRITTSNKVVELLNKNISNQHSLLLTFRNVLTNLNLRTDICLCPAGEEILWQSK